MRKIGLVLSIIIIILASIALVACAQPVHDENEIVLLADQAYSLDYKDGLADCKMALDGQGHCTITKKYAFDKEIDEESTISVSYISSSRSIYVQFEDDVLNFTDNYAISKNNQLVYYSSQVTASESYKTFQESIGQTYQMQYQKTIDKKTAQVTFKLMPIKIDHGNYLVAVGYSISVPEYEAASGEYSVVQNKYLKLKFNYSEEDTPTNGLVSYQSMPAGENYSTQLITEEDGRKNGLVRVVGSSFVKYVQLRDDGTFDFVRASTSIADSVCFTQDTYYGKSFTCNIDTIDEDEKALFSYAYKLTFDTNGKAKFEVVSATMQKNYKATSEGEITLIGYDIEAYTLLMGTHRQLGTSNNLSLANNFKVYADYNYSRYEFEGDLNILMFKTQDYYYLKAKNEDGKAIAARFYEDGTWEWIQSEFKGIDMSDHSEDFD